MQCLYCIIGLTVKLNFYFSYFIHIYLKHDDILVKQAVQPVVGPPQHAAGPCKWWRSRLLLPCRV